MDQEKLEKEFLRGYNAAIQNISFSTTKASYSFLAEAVVNSGFSKEQFEEVQKESGWQDDEMREIFEEAFD